MSERAIIVVDGSSDPHGRAGWGYVYQNGRHHKEKGRLSRASPLQSELMALLKGLQSVPDGMDCEVKTDCYAAIDVLETGGGKHNRFHELINKELDRLGRVYVHKVHRREVSMAHVLANKARKER